MKRLAVLLVFTLFLAFGLSYTACDKHPVTVPVPPPPPTATATPGQFVITMSGSLFNPDTATIAAGTNVIFQNLDGYSHFIVADDGFNNCGTVHITNPMGSSGDSVTLNFPTGPVTISYHDGIYSSCSPSECDSSCTGMVGTLYVQ